MLPSPSIPYSYTTDFDEMEQLFSLEKNPDLPMEELEAMLAEFKQDYNQKHFVRNDSFKKAADNVQGEHAGPGHAGRASISASSHLDRRNMRCSVLLSDKASHARYPFYSRQWSASWSAQVSPPACMSSCMPLLLFEEACPCPCPWHPLAACAQYLLVL